jgi:very-short-patch-repair endonuclease
LLWNAIRAKRFLGLKFRRQHAIGQFVVDFYCPSESMIIEVDGGIHRSRAGPDRERQRFLEDLGLKVLRFSNELVIEDLGTVLEQIRLALTSPRPVGHPSP